MPEVIALQHTRFETIGSIEDALVEAHVRVRAIQVHDGEPVPDSLDPGSGLIIMGGPMGVYEQDRFPYLRQEMRLIERALADDAPVLGICLGSQLLASVLGSPVRKGPRKELGWSRLFMDPAAATDPIFKDAPAEFDGFHWHGDVFDLPPASVRLARTQLTDCQAFRYGARAYGMLFHLEVTPAIVSAMIDAFANEIQEEGVDTAELAKATEANLPHWQAVGVNVWRNWVASSSF